MKILKWLGILILSIAAIGLILYGIYLRPVLSHMKATQRIKCDTNLTIELGGGGNSGVLVSDSLVIVIDTKEDAAAEVFANKVKAIAGRKPILVINTHCHADHVWGNQYYKGWPIIAGGNYTKAFWIKENGELALPTLWLKDSVTIKMGKELVTVLNIPVPAHTESDVVVYLHKRKLLFAGDLILNKQAPALVSTAADPDGYLAGMDLLEKRFDIKEIVPGHGNMGTIELLHTFRQYFLDMKIASLNKSKKSELIAKYKSWIQIPFLMSPGTTISAFEGKSR